MGGTLTCADCLDAPASVVTDCDHARPVCEHCATVNEDSTHWSGTDRARLAGRRFVPRHHHGDPVCSECLRVARGAREAYWEAA